MSSMSEIFPIFLTSSLQQEEMLLIFCVNRFCGRNINGCGLCYGIIVAQIYSNPILV